MRHEWTEERPGDTLTHSVDDEGGGVHVATRHSSRPLYQQPLDGSNERVFPFARQILRLAEEVERLASENAALKETLADQQRAERWLAGCRWAARLSLLVADFRDRATLLRGSTTWEQAYRQAAIDLEEVVEQLAEKRHEPAQVADLIGGAQGELCGDTPKRKE